ncbi:MAG TPA: helix-turn-helix domain-containing protein [Corynebacterium sp.]|nr:helix-turn-helix domain-containing protein [Corynebacterium sp.]
MVSTDVTRIKAAALTEHDLQRARHFIAADEDSILSRLLLRVLDAYEGGVDTSLVRDDAELSTTQAAKVLKMSRPHLLSFLNNGDLPCHWVGAHRRIKMKDLQEFRAVREAGAEIMANALHGTPTLVTDSTPLTKAEQTQLADL